MYHASRKNLVKRTLSIGAVLAALPIAVLWAWNVSLPELFHAPALDYKKAAGLVVLGFLSTLLSHDRTRDGRKFHHSRSGESQ